TVVTDPLGHAVTTAYDAVGNVVSVSDAVHGSTTYSFDVANRETATTNPLNQTTTLALYADGRTSTSKDALKLVTSFSYTSTAQVSVKTDPAGNAATYTYNASGDTVAVTTPPAGSSNGGSQLLGPSSGNGGANWTWTYDALHRKQTGTDPLGH